MPKFSVITVCYNAQKTIRRAVESVVSQTFSDFEYIIVDGASKDNTPGIIEEYASKVTKYVSEPDKGLYDAMNKGLALAEGEYVHFLNADDAYVDENVLEKLAPHCTEVGIYHGNIIRIGEDQSLKKKWGGPAEKSVELWKPKCLNQPSMFISLDCFKDVGGFDLQYRIAADYDLGVRVFMKYPAYYVDLDISCMHAGGTSDINAIAGFRERSLVHKRLGFPRYKILINFYIMCLKNFMRKFLPSRLT